MVVGHSLERTLGRFAVCLLALMPVLGIAGEQAESDGAERGRALVFAQDKGNCVACHHIAGGTQMGNIGPPLADMKQRFPERARLAAQIWDAAGTNMHTMMPPYGRHQILTEQELDAVVDFLYTR